MLDIAIRGGTIVDGTGSPSYRADVGVAGDRVVEIGEAVGEAALDLDARGKLVTPGFVDIHTHLDAQIGWDALATSSCWHGITSIVLGNCGVGFAPCRADDRDYLAKLMESVEDIPAATISIGLPWTWESFPGYLDFLDSTPKGLNVGAMVGHTPVRYHAMGDAALGKQPATADEIARITAMIDEAMAAGALGFSSSRTLGHRVPDGRAVPGTYAAEDELLAIADVLAKQGRGVFEIAPRLGEIDGMALTLSRQELEWMSAFTKRSGRPLTFAVAQNRILPTLHTALLELVAEQNDAGADLRAQTTVRAIGFLHGLANHTPFDRVPSWAALQSLTLDGRLAVLRNGDRRRALVRDAEAAEGGVDLTQLFWVGWPSARYTYSPDDSVAAMAEARGVSPAELFIETALETEGRGLFNYPLLNHTMEAVEEFLTHPKSVLGLADSGAHVGSIMDASQPTFFLSYWVRDTKRFALEEGVRRLTSEPADLFGLSERGRVAVGAFADLNVIDLDALALPVPEYVHDFPLGAGRYVQRASGYDATVVNGQLFMRDGEHTGVFAGTTLRG